jgi:hypothetical protein
MQEDGPAWKFVLGFFKLSYAKDDFYSGFFAASISAASAAQLDRRCLTFYPSGTTAFSHGHKWLLPSIDPVVSLSLMTSQIPLGLMPHTPFASSSSITQSGINRWYVRCIRHNQLKL